MKIFKTYLISVFLLLPFSASFATPILYQGIDVGAASFAAGVNSQAASALFDAASGPLNIIDFDTNNTGATLSPVSSPQNCGFALCGGNTTAGGSNFFGHVFTTTITFDSPIDSFGAYFSGWQRTTQTLSYTDGAQTIINMPASGSLNLGGMVFSGFIDAGASISSITYNTVSGDFVAIDDMRFGIASSTIPETETLALFGLGLLGLVISRQRKLI